ncbi:serine/threonine protein kinase, partial [Myxococcota bacterium]|nr:serine/threonine protein kinase [Myxococcota bacterium]
MSTAPELLSEGRYRIERVLGVGGMSVVLLAFDNRMHVQRAIKLLHKRYAKSPQVRERFENEAYAQARLRHPNILMVHDVVDDDVGVYLVMELAEGGSLADRVKQQGPLSPREAAQVGITMCRALGVAHAEGVVHRDIKPENVLVDKHGTLKVADFGIARVVDRHGNLTQTGMVMGTWAYMPPEQRESARQVDGRADIYALGATLFYLLTGKQPTALHNPETHGREYVDFPEALARAIQKATRLYPEDRYQSCEELARDLEEMLGELGTERLADFQPPQAPPDTLAPADEDLSTFLHRDHDAAETLAPFLEPVNLANLAPADGAGTAVPGTAVQGGRTPSLYLPPPARSQPPLAAPASTAPAATDPAAAVAPAAAPAAPAPSTATIPPAAQTLPPGPAPARSGVSGSQLLIFVLGVLVAVIAIAVLLPRLVNPPAAPRPAGDAQAAAEEELLSRLVALNAARAAEEAQGQVRWLRPDYQHPGA